MERRIRSALKEDMKEVAALIRALAVYEEAGEEAELTSEDLVRDGFGRSAAFKCLVAEENGELTGMALYYPRYSTWKGRTLYLEDLVVKETYRRKGVGRDLFNALIDISRREGYRRLEWQVLDWNESAIEFYNAFGSQLDSSWLNGRITFPRT